MMHEIRIIASVLLVVGACIVAFIAGGIFLTERMELPGALAEIESLRANASIVQPQEAEDVIGQVTQWNQTIASKQRYNRVWWSAWLIPNAWDDIRPIEIPRRGN